jgi:DNA-binding transcriptional LysR family regulator
MVDLIKEGIDVTVRVGELADSRVIARRLAPRRLCAFASPAYLARRGTPRHPDELAQHDCVNFRYQSSGRTLRWPFRIGEHIVEITPTPGIIVDVGDAVIAVVAASGGIGVSATYMAARHVERGELVPILTDFAVDRFDVTALWPESRRDSPNVRAFISFLEETFPSPVPWDAYLPL